MQVAPLSFWRLEWRWFCHFFPYCRVARAGRFGTKGLAVTFVSDGEDAKTLNDVQDRFDVSILELPDEIDISSYIETNWAHKSGEPV